MNVVQLKTVDLKDVTESLRRLASQMDSGEVKKANHVIVVASHEDGSIECYGYGEVGNTAEETGLLQMAVIKMATL